MIEKKTKFDARSLFDSSSQVGSKFYTIQPSVLKQNEELMEVAVYRRLYNIIENHNFKVSSAFRNNLIKELYFLMKLSPIMAKQLLIPFLGQVEQWYDSNDHKKIKLASKTLSGMLKDGNKKPTQDVKKHQRDQYSESSGITYNFWNAQKNKIKSRILLQKSRHLENSNIFSGNRPMTAKHNGISSNMSRMRPMSSGKPITSKSKYNNLVSTVADTSEAADTLVNQNTDNQYSVNIEDQMRRNKDFLRKYRTIHPQQEPFHQQLFKLFNNPMPSQIQNNNGQRSKLKSAQFRGEQRSSDKKKTLKCFNEGQQYYQEYGMPVTQQFLQMQAFTDHFQQQQLSQNDTNQLQSIIDDDPKKKFTKDRPKTCKVNRTILAQRDRPTTGLIRLDDLSLQQASLLNRLNKMTLNQENLKHKNKIEDDQILINSLQYLKHKERHQRQTKRKNQSTQLQNIKKQPRNIKSAFIRPPVEQSHIISENQIQDQNQGKLTKISNQCRQAKVIDLSLAQVKSVGGQKKQLFKGKRPKYNQRLILSPKYDQQVEKFKKFKKNIDRAQAKALPSAFLKPIKTMSHERFDLLNYQNILNNNEEALGQIEKIKQATHGNTRVSSNALMRALFIDAYDGLQNKENLSIDHRNLRKLQPYNKDFFMVGNPNLRKKTKKKKLNKKKTKK